MEASTLVKGSTGGHLSGLFIKTGGQTINQCTIFCGRLSVSEMASYLSMEMLPLFHQAERRQKASWFLMLVWILFQHSQELSDSRNLWNLEVDRVDGKE